MSKLEAKELYCINADAVAAAAGAAKLPLAADVKSSYLPMPKLFFSDKNT
jgi:hypothetical protein